jgi:hypothetical protein
MSTSVDHATAVCAAVLAELPISEWNDTIEKLITLRKEKDRQNRDLERPKGICLISCPHQQVRFLCDRHAYITLFAKVR